MLKRCLLSAIAGLIFCGGTGWVAAAPGFAVGIGTHLTSERGLDLVQQANVHWIRDDVHWAEVEREKGKLSMPPRYEEYVEQALHRGLQPLLILCYGNSLYDRGSFPKS